MKEELVLTVPFHGDEIMAVEKDGKIYVPMKPICEAMGLEWRNQHELIRRDNVLKSTIIVTMIVASDGKEREMVCLPLEYINGWLFKVPANRYSGKQRKVIELYQRECYQALFDYWHKGGAVNPRIDEEQAKGIMAVIQRLEGKFNEVADAIVDVTRANRLLKNFCPRTKPGAISDATGRIKDRYVRGYFTSNKIGTPVANLKLQLELPLWGEHNG